MNVCAEGGRSSFTGIYRSLFGGNTIPPCGRIFDARKRMGQENLCMNVGYVKIV